MKSCLTRWLCVATIVVALPAIGYGQEATVSGTVTDSTGGVLPGVIVRAVNEASGNSFEAVTDERGVYRLPVRTGTYQLTMELAGFSSVIRTGLELLLAQQAVVNLEMAPSAVQESVTVTGESPLVDVTSSRASGNITPRQMEQLPVNGRNWQELTKLAPGSRTNAVSDSAIPVERAGGTSNRMISEVQLNLDGQQVTNSMSRAIPAPRISRDAIAEFEFVANRFDATQGRSMGAQVNAITKSGTNAYAGTFAGYFRHDRFKAADLVTGRRVPYSNQQLSGTFGGPIRKDRIHFFGYYEYEREPTTKSFTSPYPRFNVDLSGTNQQHIAGGRLDAQFTSQTRLSVRGGSWNSLLPYGASVGGITSTATAHPSTVPRVTTKTRQLSANLTQVLSGRAMNEVKVGYFTADDHQESNVSWQDNPLKSFGVTKGVPAISLVGYSIGGGIERELGQTNISFRDDFTYSVNRRGRHDLKAGGEYLYQIANYFDPASIAAVGNLDALGGAIPANIEDLFPVWNDFSTWNLTPLSPISRVWRQGIGDAGYDMPRHVYAAWLQDNWAVTPRLTLNLGVRYDLVFGALAEDVEYPPFLKAGRPADKNNVTPRVGFAFSLNDRTVLRAGFGKYFGDVTAQVAEARIHNQTATPVVNYDGRRDFASNPFNGPTPTFDQIQRARCTVARVPGCVRVSMTNDFSSSDVRIPHSYQASAGLQRQLAATMAFDTDYVYVGGRQELFARNGNLSYNPATGANYPFTDVSRLPYPDFGVVFQWRSGAWSNYHGWQTAFTKRFSSRWQATATYLLSAVWDGEPAPDTGFPLAPDFGGENTLAASDQRHRVVYSTIWDLGHAVQLSGIYFFGSGQRYATNYGGDRRNEGVGGSGRLRLDGTIVPRNNFAGDPIHRVDLRVQRRFRLRGRAEIDGILEVFNAFNHKNYGSYTTQESSVLYGKPSSNVNIAYQPRMLQLGFRLSF